MLESFPSHQEFTTLQQELHDFGWANHKHFRNSATK